MLFFMRMQVSRIFQLNKSVPAQAGGVPLLAFNLFVLCLLVLLAGCKQEEVLPVDYSAIYFKESPDVGRGESAGWGVLGLVLQRAG